MTILASAEWLHLSQSCIAGVAAPDLGNQHDWLIPGKRRICVSGAAASGDYSHASLQRAELGVDYSSVRPCVPLLGEAQNLWFRTILSEISENHLCILQYLAPVALKTPHKIDTFSVKCSKHTIK